MIDVEPLTEASQSLSDFYALGELSSQPSFCVAAKRESTAAGVWRRSLASHQWVGLARRDGEPAARVVAQVSPTLRDAAGQPLGMLGHFEARHDPEAVAALFDEALAWLRSQRVGTIVGPMDGDTWHKYRFNVGPWDEPPFLMEPFQPPYYGELWQAYGFVPVEHYYSKRVDDARAAATALEPARQRVDAQGFQLRSYRPDRYEDELRLLYQLSLEVFAENYLYEPIEWEEFRQLYDPLRQLIVPQLLWFATAPDGTPAGFLFATIDWQLAAAAASRRSGLLAKLAFAWYRGRAKAVNLKSLGVVPQHRRSGLGSALMQRGYEATTRLGYRRANLCLIREGNPSGGLDGGLGTLTRRYVLYHLPASSA